MMPVERRLAKIRGDLKYPPKTQFEVKLDPKAVEKIKKLGEQLTLTFAAMSTVGYPYRKRRT